MSHVLEINDLNFDSQVVASDAPFLLEFHAPWCGPCKAMDPIIEALAAEQLGVLKVGKIDIEESPGTAIRLGVRGAPTLVMFRGGREIGRRLGAGNSNALRALAGI